MACLIKRKKTYYLEYSVGDRRKRISLRTSTLQVAKEKMRQYESAQLRGADNPLPTKTSVADIIEKYLFFLQAKSSPRNVQKVATYLRGTFGEIAGCLKIKNSKIAVKSVKRPSSKRIGLLEISYLEQLSAVLVSAFLSSLVVHKGISAKTANHYRQNLLSLCNWAAREGGVRFPGQKNPVAAVNRHKEVSSDIRFLKDWEIAEQLAALAGNVALQTMVALYIYAGLRREEGLWLQPADFNWDAGNYGTIRIHDKVVDGKKWVPKTRSNRTVPISRDLRRYLDRYRAECTTETWFFESPQGYRWDGDNFSEFLREGNRKAGLTWSCLDYRHTFGSHLAMRGESLYKVSNLMGNSPQICEKHYAALLPECMFASVEFGAGSPMPEPPVPVEVVGEGRRRNLRLVTKKKV